VQLIVSADGIGDHLLALAAATAWLRDNPGSSARVRGEAVADGVGQPVRGLRHSPPPSLSLWSESATCPIGGRCTNVEAVQALPGPARDAPLPDEATQWAAQYAGCVILAPGAGYRRPGAPTWAVNNRVWLPSHWLTLEACCSKSGPRVRHDRS